MTQDEKVGTLSSHIQELRKMLMYSVITIIATTILCYTFLMEQIMWVFNYPLEKLEIDLVYTGVSEAFIVQIKLALLAGIICAVPVVFFFLWRFIGPALFPKEKKLFLKIIVPVMFLFVVGIVFAYFVVYDYALQFFLVTMSAGLTPMLTINKYISFMYSFILPFGITFELPLAIFVLTYFNVLRPATLKKKRKYVILVIVILSAVITPPDIVSMGLLAAPIYLLYEIGIFMAVCMEKAHITKKSSQEG